MKRVSPPLPPAAPLSFRRASVTDQVERTLAEAIAAGAWGGTLPGGQELARRLGTSRDSVRAALARLAQAGIVRVRTGRRAELPPSPRRRAQGKAPRVCVVAPVERKVLIRLRATTTLFQVQAAVTERGIAWEEIFDGALGGRLPERRLEQMVAGRPGVCWVLVLATPAIQRWFEAAGLPVLVMGSCFKGVRIPSVDIDYHAVGWHAAGRLRRLGHRRIALVMPKPASAGDLACRSGLREFLAREAGAAAVEEVAAGDTPEDWEPALARLLARPHRPTAIVAMKPAHALTALGHLLWRGWRLPRDISLVSRDSHPLFDFGLPRLTRYSTPPEREAAMVVRLVQRLLSGKPAGLRPGRLMPEFIPGDTLGPAAPEFRVRLAPDQT